MHPQLDSDAALLEMLTADTPLRAKSKLPRRDAALDPLMIAAAIASGPHVTRNHAAHDFLPGVQLPQHEGSWDWTNWSPDDLKQQQRRLTYVSRQAPRRQRLGNLQIPEAAKENDSERDAYASPTKRRRQSLITPTADTDCKSRAKPTPAPQIAPAKPGPITVKCMARTRIPTPHGPAFLHLYHNNRDGKEHLAIVVDSAQYAEPRASPVFVPPIRSASLDAVWDPNETEMDRITRGAYVGRLSPTSRHASTPLDAAPPASSRSSVPSPLVRIHSECFTGETVGSMRCDCGEQLDEALRLISQPVSVPLPDGSTTFIPGRGAVIYLRQEGRGIGLLSKIRAYNLQDLGHDTVTANLLLGHEADERGYEVAGTILRDLGLGPNGSGEGIRLLTNNPDKVEALQREGVRIVERVPMVPRSWRTRGHTATAAEGWLETDKSPAPGATLIGGHAVHGPDLDKYLRTKVLRMGHMLPLLVDGAVVGQ